MKNASNCAKKLTALVKKLPDPPAHEWPDADDPIATIVLSFLMWEASTDRALNAHRKIMNAVVDHNDLRVSVPHETAAFIGANYPRCHERCERLRAVLRDIYLREHEVSLASLDSLGKREVRKYIESLEGMNAYVANRLMLLRFDIHAIPVDSQLRVQLIDAGAADEDADIDELSSWLTRQIKAADAIDVHHRLQAWIDKVGSKVSRSPKKTTKTSRSSAKSGGSRKKTTTTDAASRSKKKTTSSKKKSTSRASR